LLKAYKEARERASEETSIYLDNLPEECPYSLDEILHSEFLPE
jgi:hypothetical protein